MNDFNYFFSGLVIFGVMLALILGIVIWSKSTTRSDGNRYLGLCLMISSMTYALYGSLYLIEGLALEYARLFFVPLVLELMILPFCYLYIRSLFSPIHADNPIQLWLHFAPFVVGALSLSPILLLAPETQIPIIKSWFTGEYTKTIPLSVYFIALILLAQIGTYLYLILRAYLRCKSTLEDIFSDTDSIKHRWVAGIIGIWFVYLLIHLLCFVLPITATTKAVGSFGYLFIAINLFFYVYVAIQGLRHPFLFDAKHANIVNDFCNKASERKKYSRSPLSHEKAQTIKNQLMTCLEVEKPFLDPELTVNDLAKAIGLSKSRELTQVLSGEMQESFYELINRYRIEEAKRLLQQKSALTILDIALDSGFKSTTTFYNHFKKRTGMTPKQYLRTSSG